MYVEKKHKFAYILGLRQLTINYQPPIMPPTNKHHNKRYLITAGLPYSNGKPHVGHVAGAYLPADTFARYLRLNGADALYICGSDDHGTAITFTAEKEGKTPREIAAFYNKKHLEAYNSLGIYFDIFGSTCENPYHYKTSQDFFLEIYKKGLFEKIETEQFYDTIHETFLADRYVKGECGFCGAKDQNSDQCEECGKQLDTSSLKSPYSTITRAPAILKKTSHWFLDLSKTEEVVKNWIEHAEVRENTANFVKGLISTGLVKRSMTRDISWGIPVPLDDPDAKNKVLYVWFDAPIGYISNTKELCEKKFGNAERYVDWWKSPDCKIYHFIGEDNTVFHAIIWIAMLHTEGTFSLPTGIIVNNYLNIKLGDNPEEKISKSRSSASSSVWVDEFIAQGGDPDGLRYYLTMIAPEQNRTAYNPLDYVTRYNNELGNTLGNLVSRIVSMINKNFDSIILDIDPTKLDENSKRIYGLLKNTKAVVGENIENYYFKAALENIMSFCRECNKYIDEEAPWKLVKTDKEKGHFVLSVAVNLIKDISILITPFMPFTAEKIAAILKINQNVLDWDNIGKMLPEMQIGESEILFPKIQ